jgi:hypothetical protein
MEVCLVLDEEYNDPTFYYDPRAFRTGNSFLVPGGDWEVENTSPPQTFFSMFRGVSRICLYLSIGLFSTFAARLFGLLPGYLILVALAIAGCIIYISLSRNTSERIFAAIVMVSAILGIVGGSWDAIYATFATSSGQKLGLQISIVSAVLSGTVGLTLLFRRRR